MCKACGKPINIEVSCTPLQISFPAKVNTFKKEILRSGDLSGEIILDLYKVTLNNYENYRIKCKYCGEILDTKEILGLGESTCFFCKETNKETFKCSFNEVMVCKTCFVKWISYCSACPFKQNCDLYGDKE